MARRRRVTIAEWVRQALRKAKNDDPSTVEGGFNYALSQTPPDTTSPPPTFRPCCVRANLHNLSRDCFVDSNIPMYLVGAPHLNKDRAIALLTRLVRDGERFITDVDRSIKRYSTATLR